MTSLIFLLFISILALTLADPNIGRACKEDEQGAKPGIYYYDDKECNNIYPFFYHGCGATEEKNRFATHNEAISLLPESYDNCRGNIKPTGHCPMHMFQTVISKDTEGNLMETARKPECKEGSKCDFAFPFARCCPIDVTARFYKNRLAACEGEKKSVKVDKGFVHEGKKYDGDVLFGRSCAHNFCPAGSDCVDGEFEAYCCKEKTNV